MKIPLGFPGLGSLIQALIFLLALVCATCPAQADVTWHYGQVSCSGNKALIRFTMAANDDAPNFEPSPLGGTLNRLAPRDPSRCRLSDGREVLLKHIYRGDSWFRGECGGDSSEIFSLWIGHRRIYNRETFYNKCDAPYSIRSILYDGRSLRECRIGGDGPADEPRLLGCRDESRRLRNTVRPYPQSPRYAVIAKPSDRRFCQSLLRRDAALRDPPSSGPYPWSAMAHWPDVAIRDLPADLPDRFDLDNDGKAERVVAAGEMGNIWIGAPAETSDADMNALQKKIEAETEPDFRSECRAGIKIFDAAGGPYRDRDSSMAAMRSGGRTYLSLAPRQPLDQHPAMQVGVPQANGNISVICRYEGSPDL